MGKHMLPRERVKYTTPVLQSHIDESEPCNKGGDRLAKQAKRQAAGAKPQAQSASAQNRGSRWRSMNLAPVPTNLSGRLRFPHTRRLLTSA